MVDFDALAQGVNSLVVDFQQAVDLVIDDFIAKGHQRIGLLSGVEFTKDHHQEIEDPRRRIFEERLRRLKLHHPQYHLNAPFTVEGGYEAMKEYLQQNKELPSALFSSSDALAIGAMRALQEKTSRFQMRSQLSASMMSVSQSTSFRLCQPSKFIRNGWGSWQ